MEVHFLSDVGLELTLPNYVPEPPQKLAHLGPLSGVEDFVDGENDPIEFLALSGELLFTCGGQGVETCAAVVLGRAPFRFHPSLEEQSL
jgi:hypothetical protein